MALMAPTVVATAEDDRKPAAKITVCEDWVEYREAKYRLGDRVANTKHIELSVKALPRERLTILKSQEEWKNFVERFARKPAKFTPDFGSEAVVILSANKAQKEGLGKFLDIEVFKDEDLLRTFVFFGLGQPAVDNDGAKEAVAGYLYMVSIPRELAKLPVEIRMADQSWGRICSKFSPPITNPDDAERKPADRAEQGGADQPATAPE